MPVLVLFHWIRKSSKWVRLTKETIWNSESVPYRFEICDFKIVAFMRYFPSNPPAHWQDPLTCQALMQVQTSFFDELWRKLLGWWPSGNSSAVVSTLTLKARIPWLKSLLGLFFVAFACFPLNCMGFLPAVWLFPTVQKYVSWANWWF